MFVDQIEIEVTAGKGGDGIVAYRREYKVEHGGPFGGDGGRGGSIIFRTNTGLNTLLDFRYNRHIKGEAGEKGRTKGQIGACAEDTYIDVPVGTVVYDLKNNSVIADLVRPGQEAVIAKGGRGGRGNISFANGTNKCPDFCEKGEPGEHKMIRLELKVLADCGLVGFPSVGKSTLISSVSQARPKIASYHFTTLVPNLGMVEVGDGRSFVMADLPGLIEGASQGLGLGFQFLRHIERCRVIVHVVDISSAEGRDPYDDYLKIRKELEEYDLGLLDRPEIIACNKIDEPGAEERFEEFKSHFPADYPIYDISAYCGVNLDKLIYKISDTIDATPNFALEDKTIDVVEYNFAPEEKAYQIDLIDGMYVVTGEKIERLFSMTNFDNESSLRRFARQLRSFGLDEELRSLGIKNGDTVKIFDYEFEFVD